MGPHCHIINDISRIFHNSLVGHFASGTLARETTPVAKWMVTWRGNFTWPLGSHSQVATGARQHLSTLADQQSVATYFDSQLY